MRNIMLLAALVMLSSCTVPFAQLSSDVAVRQITWRQGPFFYRVETSLKNTGNITLDLMAKCEADTGGMVDVRHVRLQPNEVKTFIDKVPSPVGGEVSAKCDIYRK